MTPRLWCPGCDSTREVKRARGAGRFCHSCAARLSDRERRPRFRQVGLEEVLAAREQQLRSTAQAGENAHDAYLEAATRIARGLARSGLPFSACDVRDSMSAAFPMLRTHDDRALGSVFTTLARAGAIEKLGYRPSGRTRNHNRPVMTWRGRGALAQGAAT